MSPNTSKCWLRAVRLGLVVALAPARAHEYKVTTSYKRRGPCRPAELIPALSRGTTESSCGLSPRH